MKTLEDECKRVIQKNSLKISKMINLKEISRLFFFFCIIIYCVSVLSLHIESTDSTIHTVDQEVVAVEGPILLISAAWLESGFQ